VTRKLVSSTQVLAALLVVVLATAVVAPAQSPEGPLATSPSWTVESNQMHARLGNAVGGAGDVNGDGYADVIVGAREYDNGQTNEGRAFVYHGSPSGLSITPDWTAEGNQTSANFGVCVRTAGDVNGDGYDDVIIGAHRCDGTYKEGGRAYVYHGSATGLSTTSDWTAEADQAYVAFGYSVDTAGDVNGDGYDDIIVGAHDYSAGQTKEGGAFVYFGSATGLSATPDWTAESDQVEAYFGISVSAAGDVNGDGYDDVIVGACHYDNGETNEGAVFVYYGSSLGLSATADWIAEGNQSSGCFGRSVGTARDVNGDGYADVIVGAYKYDNGETDEGVAFIYYGSASGPNTTASWTAESDQAGAALGSSVDTAGDVNGDGYDDVIVGAQAYDNGQADEGAAFVYLGSPEGLSASADWTAESNQSGAMMGSAGAVDTAGDVNGDGHDDVIVGVNYYDNGQTNEGRAYAYYATSSPTPTPTPPPVLCGPETWTKLTTGPYHDKCPGWSPDGTYIVYQHYDGAKDLWVMNAVDGSDKSRLTYVTWAESPNYSSDGRQIVFNKYYNDSRCDIMVINADGTGLQAILSEGYNLYPDWSPDDSQVVFHRGSSLGAIHHIYTMNADGSGLTQLTTEGWINGNASWSPDGSKITFDSDRAGASRNLVRNIYVMDADGSNVTQLTSGSIKDYGPVWSPDGLRIAFLRNTSSSTNDIFIMNSDGTGAAQVTEASGGLWSLAWSPDGNKLAFHAYVGGLGDIYVLDLTVCPGWPPTPDVVEPLTLMPLHPTAGQVSPVMQGGTVHRHFELRDATDAPAPYVTVTFAPTGSGTSDANGCLDVVVNADDLGQPSITYNVVAVSASRWGETYALASTPSFAVEVHRRELSSFWGSGAGMRSRAGIGAGVKGYIKGAHEGGLDAELTERYPLSEPDDTLSLTASQTNEAGAGVGLGAEAGFKAGPVKGSLGASAEVGLTWKALEEYVSLFNDPYAADQLRAEAITALIGVYRTAMGFAQGQPGLNLLGQIILRLLEQNPDYRACLDEETIGTGVVLKGSADIGGKFDALHFGKYSAGKRRSRYLYLEAGAGFSSSLSTLSKWGTDLETGATRSLEWHEETDLDAWAGFEAGLSHGARGKLRAEIGDVKSIERRAEYTSTGTLQKLVFIVSSENRYESQAGVDIDPLRPADIDWGAIAGKEVQYQIQHRYIFEGDILAQALARAPGLAQLHHAEQAGYDQTLSALNPLQLGKWAAQCDLNALLGCTPTCLDGFTYEKWAIITTRLQPGLELGFTLGLNLELGGDFKVQWGKKVLLERGVFLNGDFYPTEVYTLDQYVDAPERSLSWLIAEAVQEGFALISDFFSTVTQWIEEGTSWLLRITARTGEGSVQGGLQLLGGTDLQSLSGPGQLRASSTFTVTASAWVPAENVATIHRARMLGIQTTDADFVVGGVYDLQPYTQTLSLPATLVITYTDSVVVGRDESLFHLYRWQADDNAWWPLAASADTARNVVTTTITSLGSYTVGFDSQPPVVDEIIPGPGAAQATYLPQFRISLSDAGSGVDPASVELTVAGDPVSVAFEPVQGVLWYTPTVPFANGVYNMSIAAADTTGNAISATSAFTIAVPPPAVGGVSPNVICQSVTSTVVITGSGFYPGLELLMDDYVLTSVEYLSANRLHVTIPEGMPLGLYSIAVTNGDGQRGELVNAIRIAALTHPTLLPGWNLVSIPVSPASAVITEVLSSIEGQYDLVYAYDASDAADPWKKYNTAAPSFLNDLTEIDATMGLWIRATEPVTLTVSGSVPSSTDISLYTGWNLVGYPSLTARPMTEALAGIEGKYDLVYAYDAWDTEDPWKKYNTAAPPFLNDLTEMGSGWGYWIRVSEDCVWRVNGG